MAEIIPALISEYKSQRLKEGARPATLNRELALAKHAYNLGLKEWGWCRENPFCKVRMERENNLRVRAPLSRKPKGRDRGVGSVQEDDTKSATASRFSKTAENVLDGKSKKSYSYRLSARSSDG